MQFGNKEAAIRAAEAYLELGLPIPTDLQADLLERYGVDIRKLERNYA